MANNAGGSVKGKKKALRGFDAGGLSLRIFGVSAFLQMGAENT
ncbi:hypothetical protein ACFXGD_14325 [Streptomyces albidoflavus]